MPDYRESVGTSLVAVVRVVRRCRCSSLGWMFLLVSPRSEQAAALASGR